MGPHPSHNQPTTPSRKNARFLQKKLERLWTTQPYLLNVFSGTVTGWEGKHHIRRLSEQLSSLQRANQEEEQRKSSFARAAEQDRFSTCDTPALRQGFKP